MSLNVSANPMHIHIVIVCLFSNVGFMNGSPTWRGHLSALIAVQRQKCIFSMCVGKCFCKSHTYSHWLHLFVFSPLWVLWMVNKVQLVCFNCSSETKLCVVENIVWVLPKNIPEEIVFSFYDDVQKGNGWIY